MRRQVKSVGALSRPGAGVGMRSRSGTITLKALPTPTLDSTLTRPHIALMICLTMLRPRPAEHSSATNQKATYQNHRVASQ